LSEASLAVSIGRVRGGIETKAFNHESLEKNYAFPDQNGKKIVSTGSPLWGTHIRIASPNSSNAYLNEGKIGEVLVKSESVMEGYLQADGTIASKKSEWLQTGDLGFIFENQLYICGRLKNLIIKNGRNIHSHDIETSLLSSQDILIENCIAVSHLTNGEEYVYIFAEVAKGGRMIHEEIADTQNVIKEKILEKYGFRVNRVILLKKHTLPRTSSGKFRHQYTLAVYLNGELASFILSQQLSDQSIPVYSIL